MALVAAMPAWAKKSKAEAEPDLTGTYTIAAGTLPNGATYDGTLTVAPKTKMGGRHGWILWSVTWNVSSAKEPVRGIGIWLDGVFIVAYGPGDGYGLTVYGKIARGGRAEWMLPDDTVYGSWFRPDGASGQEALRGDLESWNGDYRMHGHTAAGGDMVKPYYGNVSITPTGDIVHLRWTGRDKKMGKDKGFDYGGLGLPAPGVLVAQWSLNGGGGVGFYVFEGDTMTGLFAEDEGLGRETLVVPPEVAERLAPFLNP
jgi:hypothetical protein